MKLKIRMIDNTEWITNIFTDAKNIYFVDAHFNFTNSNIYQISQDVFFENLVNKADIGRVFLANPFPHISNDGLASKNTDVSVFKSVEGYVQNILFTADQTYLSWLVDGQVQTSLESSLDRHNVQLLQQKDDKILGIVEKKLVWLDAKLQVVQDLNVEAVNAVVFKNKIIYQQADNSLWQWENGQSTKLLESKEFVSIFYLNQNNLLISYKETNQTTMLNIETKCEMPFCDFYIFRAVLVGKETLLCKALYDNNHNPTLTNKLLIIS